MRSLIVSIVSIAAGCASLSATSLMKIMSDNPIKVAVIDTGYDSSSSWAAAGYSVPNLCRGKGFDLVLETATITDSNGHGTHIAGLIAKHAGQSDYCIIPYRYYDQSGEDIQNVKRGIIAIRMAIEAKADIINYSGGGIERSELECNTIKQALDAGIIFVAAAGNNYSNLTHKPFYPAMCDERIIVVSNEDKYGNLVESSNYVGFLSDKTIKMFREVGVDVPSLWPNNRIATMTGTSQSTAVMTGKLVEAMNKVRNDRYLSILMKKANGG